MKKKCFVSGICAIWEPAKLLWTKEGGGGGGGVGGRHHRCRGSDGSGIYICIQCFATDYW